MRKLMVAALATAVVAGMAGTAAAVPAPTMYHHQMHHQTAPRMFHNQAPQMFHHAATARWPGYVPWPSTHWTASITQCSGFPNRMRVKFVNRSGSTVTVRIVGGFFAYGARWDVTLAETSPRLAPGHAWYTTLSSVSGAVYEPGQTCKLITVHRKV